ncbi:class I SAM-dependent methyltransferase [Sphingopyxis sp.]|jgi:ubiquinone/menaquinone biosynthesis C-methylase UbiE|uniref:class I SAM-dependent methyltransferase n=1 Tax=Sphingopyxis sp. TaxID=1908224 RepID=UPI003F6FB5F7
MTDVKNFTPALGHAGLTAEYDRVVAVMTRERRWRGKLLDAIAPAPCDVIIDLGSGTGSQAVLLAARCGDARIFAVDPDPDVQVIAAAKAQDRGVKITLVTAMGGDRIDALPYGAVDKVVTSLVLHQCTLEAKQALLANAYAMLRPGGRLYVADYGVQSTLLMRILFNQVRSLDGYENTRANKDGLIPRFMEAAGFIAVRDRWSLPTPTGSITLWTGEKAGR